MNIEERALAAIEKINSLSVDELEKEFIQLGYFPARKVEIKYSQKEVFLTLRKGHRIIKTRLVNAGIIQNDFIVDNAMLNDPEYLEHELAA